MKEATDLELARVLEAPRELVWKAWTDPKHLAQWWGPHGFSNPRCEVDPRKGGAIRIDMRGPDGTIYPASGTFEEVVPQERIAFTMTPLGADGEPLFETLTTITLDAIGNRTAISLSVRVLSQKEGAAMFLAGMSEGWTQSLERLEEAAIPTADQEIIATRIFMAPRDLVFGLWTDPKHLERWWGPNGFSITTENVDIRSGGEWKFVMHGPDGRNYANHMKYVEIVRPERIAYDHVSTPQFRSVATFTELAPGQTRITIHMRFATAEERDNTARVFGAVEGLQQTLGRLAKEIEDMTTTTQTTRPFVISRTFDAPRDLMWKAWTESDRLARWFGPKGASILHSKNDLRPGGMYLYGMTMPDGSMIWGKWLYREVVKPERLVFVNSFSDEHGGTTRHPMAEGWPLQWLSTITFTEKDGKTTVNVHWVPINATDAECATFEAGHASMTGGWTGTLDKLEAYLPGERAR